MYKRILIATDGSEISKRAVAQGIALAEALQAPVTAVFVIDTRALPGAHPVVPESIATYYQSILSEMRKMGESVVGEVVAAGAVAGIPVDPKVLCGSPAGTILDTATEVGADLLVMGTHGRTAIASVFLGSTAQTVCHHCRVPLLLVR